jgi:hypothetical protein
VINNKSAPLPPRYDVGPEIARFLRRLGYRLVLKELKHPAQVRPGGTLELAMKWQNVGSAPCYKPYRVACRLSNDKGFAKVFTSGVAVNRWLPGSLELFTAEFLKAPGDLPPGEIAAVTESIILPAEVPAGTYTLSIAVVDGETPIVWLGIKGRAEDGWYPLSGIEVVGQASHP